ncbi:MAG: universal stress protein [Aquirhabdus sp.]
MYKNILAAVDGSHTSDLALREAIKLAKEGSSQLIVVTVLDNPLQSYSTPSYYTSFSFDEAHKDFYKFAENILENAECVAERLGNLKVKTCLVDMGVNSGHNDIAPAIEKVASDYHADLIVIGTHGRRGYKHFFLGSVAEQVVRQARIPVLLIRSREDSETESESESLSE